MKRLTFSVLTAAAVALSAYTLAGAQQAPAGQGQGTRAPRGEARMLRGPGGPGGLMLRGIDLSDEQKAQIRSIRESARQAPQGPPEDLALQRQLQAEILSDAPNEATIADLQQKIAQAQAARLARRIEIEQRIAQVLTSEQRATLRERLDRPAGERRFGRRGPARSF